MDRAISSKFRTQLCKTVLGFLFHGKPNSVSNSVQKADNAVLRIKVCPVDDAIGFLTIGLFYSLDSDLSGGERYHSFTEQQRLSTNSCCSPYLKY